MVRFNFISRLVLVLGLIFYSNIIFGQINSPDSIPPPPDSLLDGREMQVPDAVLSPIVARENVPNRKPIPYHHLRESDLMWKKKVWRMLDLKEKINHPLYYPIDKKPFDNRYSLTDLIIFAIKSPTDPVPAYEDDEFATIPYSAGQVAMNLGAKIDTVTIEELDGSISTSMVPDPIKTELVTRYEMKEVWFFDKQRSKLEVRIVALCPIYRYVNDALATASSGGNVPKSSIRVGWVPFKLLRPYFANNEVFNPKNDAERRSFDDIFFKRHFSSYIIQETNVYNDRKINLYKFGQDALLEGEKVKQFIFKVEHDLWEF